MSLRTHIAAGAALWLLHGAAQGCGYCVQDKIAAVYDHAVVVRAAGQDHRVAFFALSGPLPAHALGMRQAIERAAESTHGVDRHSARVSVENAALSFSFSKNVPLADIQRTVRRKLATHGLALQLVSTMDRPGDLAIARSRR